MAEIVTRSSILLVKLPPWDYRTPPLGIAYLATFLKSKGMEAKVFDLNIEMYNSESGEKKKGWGDEDFHWWQSNRSEQKYSVMFEHFSDRILSFNTKTIGFSATLPSIPFLNQLLKYIKKKASDRIIIVGGPATFFYEDGRQELDKSMIDYFVISDGEIALYELLNNLGDDGTLSMDKNSSCKIWKDMPSDRTICIQTPNIMDLDSVGFPTFEEFNLSAYAEGHFTLPIIFSKGCNRFCSFCSDTVLSHPYRCRKPENVVKEIKTHLGRYRNIYTFRLADLSFNANLKFLDKFCGLIIAEGLNIKWYGQGQVRADMDKNLLSKMEKAGCRQFSLGVESFSDHVLYMMKKGYTAEKADQFIKRSKDAGIEIHIALIVGFPGETEEDFDNTLNYIAQNNSYIDRVCSLNICGFPVGSEIRKYPEKYDYFCPSGIGNWETSDRLNTMAVRKRRYNEVISRCNELGIPVDACLDLEVFEARFNKKE